LYPVRTTTVVRGPVEWLTSSSVRLVSGIQSTTVVRDPVEWLVRHRRTLEKEGNGQTFLEGLSLDSELTAASAREALLAAEKGFMETLERVQGFPTACKVWLTTPGFFHKRTGFKRNILEERAREIRVCATGKMYLEKAIRPR
jgi:hypothetical protein